MTGSARAGIHTPCPIVLVAEAEAFCPTNAGGYGSLLSQGRRKRIQLSNSRRSFAPRGAIRPTCAFNFRPTESVGTAACPLHPYPRVPTRPGTPPAAPAPPAPPPI